MLRVCRCFDWQDIAPEADAWTQDDIALRHELILRLGRISGIHPWTSHLIIEEYRGNVFMDPPLQLVRCAHCCACNPCVCVHQQYLYGETKDICRPVIKPDAWGPNAFRSDSKECIASWETGSEKREWGSKCHKITQEFVLITSAFQLPPLNKIQTKGG